MAVAVPIYEGQDFYVPRFEVRQPTGRLLPKDVLRDIAQVTYRDDVEKIGSFEITINNWDAETRDFKYDADERFDPGKLLELWLGYHGRDPMRLVITGEITELQPSFPAAGQPLLVVSGQSQLLRWRGAQESKAYRDKTDSAIAREIAGRLGLRVRTVDSAEQAEETYEYVLQQNEYAIVFLMGRARRLGYDLFIEEDEEGEPRLYFGPSVAVRASVYRLTYGRSLTEFQPSLNTANQVSSVTVRGWDAKNKKPIAHTAKRSEIRTQGLGAQARGSAVDASFKDREEVISDLPVESLEEARTVATETLERIAKELVTGSGSTVGLPDLRAGTVIQLDGLGARFSGRYFVTATTHTIGDSGYTTRFDCRREEL